MLKKNERGSLQTYFMILLGLIAVMMVLLWWFCPRKTVEVKTVIKTVYVKQDALITGATAVSISPQGVVSATGSNLSIVTATVTKETEKSTDVTKYEQAQWFILADYSLSDNMAGVICTKAKKTKEW